MFKQYINGQLVDGQGPAIRVENPANGETVAAIQGATAAQAEEKLAAQGLYMRATGASDYSSGVVAYEQSVAAGTSVDRGTTVEVRFSDSSASGEGL